MAELFGVVSAGAGLLSLGLQLIDSGVKLNNICKTYKDVPKSLEQVALEVETFGRVLQQMERNRQEHASSIAIDVLARCIDLCQRSVAKIVETISKLESLLRRHKVLGKLKAIFEDKEIKQLLDEVERAKSSLGLAHQLYLGARQEVRHQQLLESSQILVAQQTLILDAQRGALGHRDSISSLQESAGRSVYSASGASMPENRPDGDIRQGTQQIIRRPKKGSTQPTFKIRLRPWFVTRIWELCARQACAGWDVELRSYKLLPWNAPIFMLCQEGDLDGVRKLIADGEASPYDRDDRGSLPLSRASADGEVDVCRFLLSIMGSNVSMAESLKIPSESGESVYALLLEEFQLDADDIMDDAWKPAAWWEWCPNLASMRIVQRSCSLPYHDMPLSVRFRNAMALSVGSAWLELFVQALGPCSNVELAFLYDQNGQTALHRVAECLSDSTHPGSQDRTEGVLAFLQKLVLAGADVHGRVNCAGVDKMTELVTPLQSLFLAVHSIGNGLRSLRLWLRTLQDMGIDLLDYGQVECELWRSQSVPLNFEKSRTVLFRAKKLVYASDPEQWDIWGRIRKSIRYWHFREVPGQWAGASWPHHLPWKPSQADEVLVPSEHLSSSLWSKKRHTLTGSHWSSVQILHDYLRSWEDWSRQGRKRFRDTQDDAGPCYLATMSAQRKQKPTCRRSSSQPPNILCSLESDTRYGPRMCNPACWHDNSDESCRLTHGYHYCRLDSRWRLEGQYVRDNHGYPRLDQHACLTGAHDDKDILREIYWDLMEEHGFWPPSNYLPSSDDDD